jgi:hypothetical protein
MPSTSPRRRLSLVREPRGRESHTFSLADVSAGMLSPIQARREYPAVSVIIATEGPTFTADDRARGQELVTQAARRLAYEYGPSFVAEIVDPLREALAETVGARVNGGVALLRGAHEMHAFRLTITPTERVVVDPTFATRDLVRSVAESEPYGIVVLAKDRARLIVVTPEGARDVAEIDERQSEDDPVDRRGHLHQAERSVRDQHHIDAFIARVGHRVNNEPVLRSLDLVVVAPDHLSTRFERSHQPAHGARIAGRIPGNRLKESPETLARLARTVIASHRSAIELEVLDELARADREGRADRGIDATWQALNFGSGLRLVVEHDFAFAAYLASDGIHVLPAAVPETPSATDDLVDEMIELALLKSGSVAFVAPGSLNGDGVAVIREH